MHPDKRTHLIKLLGMLGSDHEGEVVNAARMAQRLLGSEGMTWVEVLAPNGHTIVDPGSYNAGYAAGYAKALNEDRARRHTKIMTWFAFVRELQDEYENNLSEWEQGFVQSFIQRGFARPTPRQRDVFFNIAEKLGIDLPE